MRPLDPEGCFVGIPAEGAPIHTKNGHRARASGCKEARGPCRAIEALFRTMLGLPCEGHDLRGTT